MSKNDTSKFFFETTFSPINNLSLNKKYYYMTIFKCNPILRQALDSLGTYDYFSLFMLNFSLIV